MTSRSSLLLASALAGVSLLFTAPPSASASTPPLLAPASASAGVAPTNACFTWNRSLGEGTSGEDVRQLQIRVAGYPGSGGELAIDGEFGTATRAAVQRFQAAYGLEADGVAGPLTFGKIYEPQKGDCSPAGFDWSELNQCGTDWTGGQADAATVQTNVLVTMWKLQALRHAMGDRPIGINDGFRDHACNDAVGGAPDSLHLYGLAADMSAGSQGFCALALQAREHGFTQILGPGYPGHDDHVHVAGGTGRYWSAPSCGL
ncbi:D-Ala-D-Ala carboxypeptidase family metallohydrolase [Streptomyces anulatus]|uniref:D-Ala-D-Ala carboxypeptidase family metallohydrolase n=1 Tax=Streptomyces anulatus TaxID=1892 RepID=UPI0006DA6225|nr:D-Ala-D-Ala carboxypeptidase family metallohydrolase [Streptomyces anulatus]KPL30537.1 peptidase M15 [Streptomyces anulatus]WSC66152.1 D-Ala-D-Ala carboxypeptidase family metallohydrolase [Streptomyces anulatus]WTC61159.1 D-Ala-D-Ala carboxypeptidase family metallohydrolase [Streptomyces anulatus]